MRAFDLWMKRRAALAWKYPYPYFHETLQDPPQLTRQRLPRNLTLRAIAERCGFSLTTLSRLQYGDFRVAKLKRKNVQGFAERYYRP